MTSNDKTYIIIPAFNEGPIIGSVVKDLQNSGYKNIILVDDGSSDATSEVISRNNIISAKHSINRGKGAAIKTGIEIAKFLGATKVITIDGDGQHNPADVSQMIKLLDNGYEVVLGTRKQDPKNMPRHKIVANKIGNFFTWLIYGLWVQDSQSGFRAYSQKAIGLLDTKTDRYEYDSEVIKEIYRHNLRFTETPIETRYTKYSINKPNKQNLKNGMKTLLKMIISE